jgi:glycerol-3-phosphate acyltransferase PlsX
MRPALAGVRKEFAPDTTGGAVLLGLRSPTVVGHGRSGPEGIANAVRLAARCIEQRAVERTGDLLRSGHATRGDLVRPDGSAEQIEA